MCVEKLKILVGPGLGAIPKMRPALHLAVKRSQRHRPACAEIRELSRREILQEGGELERVEVGQGLIGDGLASLALEADFGVGKHSQTLVQNLDRDRLGVKRVSVHIEWDLAARTTLYRLQRELGRDDRADMVCASR